MACIMANVAQYRPIRQTPEVRFFQPADKILQFICCESSRCRPTSPEAAIPSPQLNNIWWNDPPNIPELTIPTIQSGINNFT